MFFGGGYGHDEEGDWEDETAGQEGGEKKQANTTQYYELLEVTKDATTQQIKKAFRKKALKQHPDKGGNPERFKRLKEAYDTLLDPAKRQLYNQYGEEGVKNGGPPGMGSNIFDFFNQRQQDNKPKKMKPKLVKLDITLEQVFLGTKKEVKVTRYRVCSDCDGKGGSKVEKCGDCKGNGITVKMVQLGPGMYTQAQTRCQKCGGNGEKIAEQAKCKSCDGKKVKQQQKTLQVIVQPGVPDQHDYIFHGESDQLPGIMAGDVYVRIQIQKHEKYQRRGADLHYHIQITLLEAITGVTTKIVHLDGKQYVVATAPGEILANKEPKTLKRMGMPFYKDPYSHGNMYFDFKVVFPPNGSLKTDQEEVLRKAFNYSSRNAGLDKKENTLVLQDFSEELLNPKASKVNPDQQEEEEGQSQGIQCQQQ